MTTSGGTGGHRLGAFAAASIVAGILLVVTLLWHDWAEVLFGIDPDSGSGSFEAAVSLLFALIAMGAGLAAIVELRRTRGLVHR